MTSPVVFIILSLLYTLFPTTSVSEPVLPLEGRELRCCTLIESPIVYKDQTGRNAYNFDGIALEYLGRLEGKLGFRCKTLELFKANSPDPQNQSFTGFIYQMEQCTRNGTIIDSPKCQCDIGVGGWALNQERLGRVDFLPSFLNDDCRMLTHVDNINSNSASGAFFLTAFSTSTWAAIWGLILFFIFLKLFDRKFAAPDPQLLHNPPGASRYTRLKNYMFNSRLPERLKTATKNTLLQIIGQSTDNTQGDSQSTRQWFISYLLLLSGLFLILAYEATMTASLVQEVPESDFRTVEDLKTCRLPADDVCVIGGGAELAYWNTVIAKSECNLKPGAPKPTIVNSYEEGLQRAASKQCKYLISPGATAREAAKGRYCSQIATTGEPFHSAGLSYVLPKDSNLTRIFSSATLQLRILGAVDSLDQYFRRRGECKSSSSSSLTYGRLRVFFIMAFSAGGFMFIVSLVFPQRSKQGQNTRETSQAVKDIDTSENPVSTQETSSSECV